MKFCMKFLLTLVDFYPRIRIWIRIAKGPILIQDPNPQYNQCGSISLNLQSVRKIEARGVIEKDRCTWHICKKNMCEKCNFLYKSFVKLVTHDNCCDNLAPF